VVSNLPFANDPEKEQHEQARIKAAANLRRLDKSRNDSDSEDDPGRNGNRRRRPRKDDLVLDQYESQIAMEVVAPDDIPVGFDGIYPRSLELFEVLTYADIGGLDDIIEELKESVIYPLTMPHLYSHSSPLLSAPSGVLLYGPPGCGEPPNSLISSALFKR